MFFATTTQQLVIHSQREVLNQNAITRDFYTECSTFAGGHNEFGLEDFTPETLAAKLKQLLEGVRGYSHKRSDNVTDCKVEPIEGGVQVISRQQNIFWVQIIQQNHRS